MIQSYARTGPFPGGREVVIAATASAVGTNSFDLVFRAIRIPLFSPLDYAAATGTCVPASTSHDAASGLAHARANTATKGACADVPITRRVAIRIRPARASTSNSVRARRAEVHQLP